VTTSVVIVSYRPGDWRAPCVASVVGQADQVIVVDNGSAGEEASAIARKGGAETVRSTKNRGFTGGFNAGLRRAGGDVIGVINDDATAEPGWLAAAQRPLGDPSVAAVTPKVLLTGWWGEVDIDDQPWSVPGDARVLGRRLVSVKVGGAEVLDRVVGGVHRLEGAGFGDEAQPVPWRWTARPAPFYVPLDTDADGRGVTVNGDPVTVTAVCRLINHAGSSLHQDGTASEVGLGAPDDGRLDQPADRFGFSGTAPVFRAETLRRIGGLANPFFAYGEDTDWCLRAHLAGLRVAYEPAAVVRHRMSATSGGAKAPLVRLLTERNAVLALVRNAPEIVATSAVRRKLELPVRHPVRLSLLRYLPWAVSSRQWLRRSWTVSPVEMWTRWADIRPGWDTAPVDLGWIRAHRGAADVPAGGGDPPP
jgi:N-acetylglucosaminyl-diphospho-decaprenol L-rhamnosyltransferase